MTFREFVQQRRNQQLAEGSSGRGKTQRRLMQAYGPMFRDLGIPRNERSTVAIDPVTGFMHAPHEIIRRETGGSLNDREIAQHVQHYTASALDQNPEHFKKLVGLQAMRHLPRSQGFVNRLENDMHQHLKRIDAAREIANIQGDQSKVDHLNRMRHGIEFMATDKFPLQYLRREVPKTSVKPSPVRMGNIPQSQRLQDKLRQNRKRLEQLGKSRESDSDSPFPRKG